MTSIGATEIVHNTAANGKQFNSTSKIKGQVHHKEGSLLLMPIELYRFLQIYFMGGENVNRVDPERSHANHMDARCGYNNLNSPEPGASSASWMSWKNPLISAGFEPENLGSRGEHVTSRPPRPTSSILTTTNNNNIQPTKTGRSSWRPHVTMDGLPVYCKLDVKLSVMLQPLDLNWVFKQNIIIIIIIIIINIIIKLMKLYIHTYSVAVPSLKFLGRPLMKTLFSSWI